MLRSAVRVLPKFVRTTTSICVVTSNGPQTVSRAVRCSYVPSRSLMERVHAEMEISKGEKLNDFESAKVRRKFALYDINGDGCIKHDDYEEYIQTIQKAYDLAHDDPLLHAFKNEFEAHWQRMLRFMDENKDGILSIDEWMDFYPRVTRTAREHKFENLPQFLQTLADAFFTLMDTKEDGIIDAQEYSEFWAKWERKEVDLETSKQHIRFMTKDGKHTLNREHFRDVHADYTWSKRPDTIGKYAYGPIKL